MNLKEEILSLVTKYYHENFKTKSFKEGDHIPYAGRVFDENELVNLVDSSLEFWLTSGRYTQQFESELADFIGVKYASFVNSGSSANLLAFYALTASNLGEKRIYQGDEIITVAAGFPTTITPIIQYGAVPVFVDVEIPGYNIDISAMKNAISDKTKAVMVAHTLGNPFNLSEVRHFCDENNLWLIEDNCDALGSKYMYEGKWKYTGSIGDIGTSSFYPPHHMTTGEGGAVYTSNYILSKNINSFRDWGRDCWCPSGVDNTCKARFTKKFGELPLGYDHKYVYSNFGFNLKSTDMQAAIGVAQLQKLPYFIQKRSENWQFLSDNLKPIEKYFYLPKAQNNSEPSWFGFILTLKDNAPFSRNDIVMHLENQGIQTRNLFAGNITLHPCFDEMRKNRSGYRIEGKLDNTNKILHNSFWVGVYPGMTEKMLSYMVNTIINFIERY